MHIKINKDQIKLKSPQQLSCKEYMQLMSDKRGVNVLTYINATTKHNYTDIQNLEPKSRVLNRINMFIGELPDVDFFFKKGKPQQNFVFNDQLFNLKKETSITLGTRQAYTDFTKDNDKTVYEAALFTLAVIVNNLSNRSLKYDSASVDAVYNSLLDKNFLDTMPSAVFFLKKLTNG